MFGLLAIACMIGVSAGAPNDLGTLPISLGYAHDKISVPRYNFHYAVNDPHTGDNKAQSESRDGGVVKGSYSLTEPDGTLRVVDYKADSVSGFHADVKRIAPVHHQIAAPVKLDLDLAQGGLGFGYGGYGKAGLGLDLGYGGYDKANLGLGIGYGAYDKASLGLGLGYGSYNKASLDLGLGYGGYDKAGLGLGLGYSGYNKAGLGLGYDGYDKAGLGLGLGYGGYDKVGLGLSYGGSAKAGLGLAHGDDGLGLGGLKGAWLSKPLYDSKY